MKESSLNPQISSSIPSENEKVSLLSNQKSTKPNSSNSYLININTKESLYSKYNALSTEDLLKENDLKKQLIIDYHSTNKSLKEELGTILEKLNSITKEKLNDIVSANKFILSEKKLESFLDLRKKDCEVSKKFNSAVKQQYSFMTKKVSNNNNKGITQQLVDYKINLNKIQNENNLILKEIKKNQSQKVLQQNKVKLMKYEGNKNGKRFHLKERLNRCLRIKNDYLSDMNNMTKLIDDNKTELNNLEKLVNKKKKVLLKNEKLNSYIENIIFILKKDLEGNLDEINEKCLNNEMDIFSLIKTFESNNNNHNRPASSNENNKSNKNKKSIYLSNDENFNNTHDPLNNNKNVYRIKISSNVSLIHPSSSSLLKNDKNNNNNKYQNQKLKLIKPNQKMFKSQSFITGGGLLKNSAQNNLNQINSLIENLNSNGSLDDQNNNKNENISNSRNINSTKNLNIKKINNLPYLMNNDINNILISPNIVINGLDLDNIDYNLIDNEIYQKLIDTKNVFLTRNERLSFDVKEIKKTFSSKYTKTAKCLDNNISKLNEIKDINTKLNDEIECLKKILKGLENGSTLDESKINQINEALKNL